jgi:hypothetical protein
VERARTLIGESLRLCRDAGMMRQIALCLHALAGVAVATGEPTQAATLFASACKSRWPSGHAQGTNIAGQY